MDKSTGWCSHYSRHHIESCNAADPFQLPTECPKLAKSITGIFIDGNAGSNSLFGGHDNMVGKRISQEFSQSSTSSYSCHDKRWSNETHLKSVFIVFIKPRKPLGASMIWDNGVLVKRSSFLSAPIIIVMHQPCLGIAYPVSWLESNPSPPPLVIPSLPWLENSQNLVRTKYPQVWNQTLMEPKLEGDFRW